MNYDESGWRSFLTEAKKPAKKPKMYTEHKLLRELDDDEYEYIRDAVDSMGPEELAFNDLFDGKTRLVLDFPTMNTSSDLGKFVGNFREMGYDVDWEKGLISGERELKDGSIAASVASLMGHEPSQSKKRKVQMKIGKFWAKIYELTSKREELAQKVSDSINPTDRGLGSRRTDTIASRIGSFTGNQIEAALDEPEQKRYQQLADQLEMYLGFIVNPLGRVKGSEDAKKNQEYWQQNADYIKKNIGSLSENKYSIIVSRDPIDILRMSDFDRITSCHSPPSRGGDTSYYKCAAAEAHGHGAVAYAVETEQLFHATNTSNIESAEQEINNDGEIFADGERGSQVGLSTEMLPVSRLRLRQVRSYADRSAAKYGNGPQIAVPESRVYGMRIPGFRDRVFNWAKESQSGTISTLSPDDGWLVKYGGSYEDNNIKELVKDLTGIEYELMGQNTETEDSLPEMDFLQAQMRNMQQEVTEKADDWNNRYQACYIEGEVTDDHGGSFYIQSEAHINIDWEIGEWESMPESSFDIGNWISELQDYEWNWASDGYGTRLMKYSNSTIRLTIEMDIEELSGGDFAYDADSFENVCYELNTVDDLYDSIKQEITRMAQRDGFMAGGTMNEWGQQIENGDVDYYEWDMTANEEDHMLYTEIEGSHTAYPAIPEGMSIQDARTILESRDFTIPLRKTLVEKAWAANQTSEDARQYPDFRVYTEEIRTQDDENIRLVLTFGCTDSSSDAQVNSMVHTIEEWEDEEVLDAAIQAVFNQIVGGGLTGRGDMDTPPAQTTNESIVKNWKNFLHS
jgi:hypothetical protein